MQKFSYLKSTNADYIDDIFARYSQDPTSVDESWRYFFEGIELGTETAGADGAAMGGVTTAQVTGATAFDLSSEAKVADLINAYRENGILVADIDPLSAAPSSHPLLELSSYGLSSSDLSKTFQAGKLIGMGPATLNDIIARLKQTYCGTIGVEFVHIQNREARLWLQSKMEASRNQPELDAETRRMILRRLSESEGFERFLHTRYVAQKRFSIEGGESVIPALDSMIETAASFGAHQILIGMAHRGRLNVLTNVFGKKPEYIFTEFEGQYKVDSSAGEGDVKYHKGHSSDVTTRQGKAVHLSLASNPSHLEFVNAVVEGSARAKQFQLKDKDRSQVIPILIHGDAAFAGQGVCYEVLNMSRLEGYTTGGTLHIVINNQVGFTTSPMDARSSRFSTDLAKMLDSPIFHVNGDDPEAVWYASRLATEYRQKFKLDTFIDLVCYRKHGHNEGDEPSFTQPLLYKKIKAHASTREIYAQKLVQLKVVSEADAQKIVDDITAHFTEAQTRARAEIPQPYTSVFEAQWKGMKKPSREDLFKPVRTEVSDEKLKQIAGKINHIPESFHLHPKLNRFFEARLRAIQEGRGIDWGNAEALAYATLVSEGNPVRLSGQDVERGTFTHRHSILNDVETGEKYSPLNNVAEGLGQYCVYNSHLSETGVLGFEHGYALAAPNTLTIWEAQFGDFANGAQVIIDQFISSSESKWQRMSGLTLLLPHGYEGQGPEHSSARLERFLAMGGRNNMFVCNLTTPAQIFHALRRQVKADFRKPLIIMSPKSLLRHPMAVSELSDLSQRGFQEIIDDAAMKTSAGKVKRVLICSGKIYYELVTARAERKIDDVAIVRLEEIHPFPSEKMAEVLNAYSGAKELVWVQEEPRNMGAWTFVFNTWAGGLDFFQEKVGGRSIRYVGRDIGAAPAVGSNKLHGEEQKAIIEKSFSAF
ncbi:MAG: 2-oxoglutarate dehydrogenase E1 component [Methylotenera sp.]|nr:2-oxoglutarate dehydrogenase E1 component [Oligoflexia bacterium]